LNFHCAPPFQRHDAFCWIEIAEGQHGIWGQPTWSREQAENSGVMVLHYVPLQTTSAFSRPLILS
jgi:hypothetical protein